MSQFFIDFETKKLKILNADKYENFNDFISAPVTTKTTAKATPAPILPSGLLPGIGSIPLIGSLPAIGSILPIAIPSILPVAIPSILPGGIPSTGGVLAGDVVSPIRGLFSALRLN